eukprot:CAMPEP_0195074444 /NCGR_PEP_ID=MMETSP0448-20130528/17550_1 /TAXON_ID=66468 /ORGANISM="Heterocapsa triquestra, Strain CCMP 448" /LENGTH=52 /DNA_ID=CAMNT_0040106701 /DNA_START=36 /DNA_END=191 /DNA_ORIENTATION=-
MKDIEATRQLLVEGEEGYSVPETNTIVHDVAKHRSPRMSSLGRIAAAGGLLV